MSPKRSATGNMTLSQAKSAAKNRIKAEGRMTDYEAMIRLVVIEGVSIENAWRAALQYFKPQDGSPVEAWYKLIPVAIEKIPKSADHVEPSAFVIQAKVNHDHAMGLIAKKDSKAIDKAEADSETLTAGGPGFGKWWRDLVAATPVDREASERGIARWVFESAFQSLDKITADSVPCVGAIGMLFSIRQSQTAYNDFVRNIWVKCLPTQAQLNSGTDFKDDDREILEHLDRLTEEFNATIREASTDRPAPEREVPASTADESSR